MKNFKVGNIALLREETSRKKCPIGRVISIQKDKGSFVGNVNSFVGTNEYLSTCVQMNTQIFERLANKLVLLFESNNENNSEQ